MIDEGHPVPEPDRRYWRRRVNRHVHKARRVRTLLRLTGIVAANLAIGAVLVVPRARWRAHFATSDELAVREILVEGTARTTPEAVRAVLHDLLRPQLRRSRARRGRPRRRCATRGSRKRP
jgi:hypothetical protein